MAVAGYLSTMLVGATVVKDIMTYDLPFSMDTEETTALSSTTPGTKTFIPTLLGMKLKASGNWNIGNAGQLALETAFFARTKVTLNFSPDGTRIYALDGWVTDYNPGTDVKSKVKVDFNFLMDGGVTITP
jgi:hypothetical protein